MVWALASGCCMHIYLHIYIYFLPFFHPQPTDLRNQYIFIHSIILFGLHSGKPAGHCRAIDVPPESLEKQSTLY